MKKEEIKKVLEDFIKLNFDYDYEDNYSTLPDALSEAAYESKYSTNKPKQLDSYIVKSEERFGGEGQGDAYWEVFSVTPNNEEPVYVKFDGWYASHHGHEYDGDDFTIVQPKEVTVRQWAKV